MNRRTHRIVAARVISAVAAVCFATAGITAPMAAFAGTTHPANAAIMQADSAASPSATSDGCCSGGGG
jgi:hypothetical protein